jgi:hypothetical protein
LYLWRRNGSKGPILDVDDDDDDDGDLHWEIWTKLSSCALSQRFLLPPYQISTKLAKYLQIWITRNRTDPT